MAVLATVATAPVLVAHLTDCFTAPPEANATGYCEYIDFDPVDLATVATVYCSELVEPTDPVPFAEAMKQARCYLVMEAQASKPWLHEITK